MKKVSQEKMIELLKNKGNKTYKELAEQTGYHPKSLIRLNRKLTKENYIPKNKKIDFQTEIINDYLKSNYKSYKDFYLNELKYRISYSSLCKILSNFKVEEEIVFIKKIKQKGNYYFEVIDYKTETMLFNFTSLKNDRKSFQKIFYFILSNYGAPQNISFVNFFTNTPLEVQYLANKYSVKILPFKSIYKNVKRSENKKRIHYKKANIDYKDFYHLKIRKTIADNMIQFENIRYRIETKNKIQKNEIVTLFYNDTKEDLFIKYKNKTYHLTIYKKIKSKKGNSKYH